VAGAESLRAARGDTAHQAVGLISRGATLWWLAVRATGAPKDATSWPPHPLPRAARSDSSPSGCPPRAAHSRGSCSSMPKVRSAPDPYWLPREQAAAQHQPVRTWAASDAGVQRQKRSSSSVRAKAPSGKARPRNPRSVKQEKGLRSLALGPPDAMSALISDLISPHVCKAPQSAGGYSPGARGSRRQSSPGPPRSRFRWAASSSATHSPRSPSRSIR
jgi:hypothetical protein